MLLRALGLVMLPAVLLVLRSTHGSEEAMQESLYSADDPILQLSYKNFNESIYHQKKAFFVEFYSSWCGHCIAFAPLWKELAKAVTGWNRVVEIAAVNCALDSNFGLCQEHNLNGYPTLKYFPYQSSNGPSDGHLYDGLRHTAAEMMAGIANLVATDYEQQKPPTWPDFSVAHDNKPSDNLWHSDTKYLVMIFENYPPPNKTLAKDEVPPSVGSQALLDFLDAAEGISIRRATSQHQMARIHDIKHFPGLLIFSRSQTGSPSYISKEALTPRDVILKIKHNTHLASTEYAQKKASKESAAADLSKRYFVHYTDLVSAITYTFKHEIPMGKRIAEDKLKALKQFLETLTRYFPGPEPMRRLLFRMTSWLNEKGDAVSADEWLAQLNKVQDELGRPLAPNISWVACKGSAPRYRGYPCSMWTMFHTLTVAAYKMDGSKSDFKPLDILQSIRGYLKHFFGCRQCVDNFEKSGVHMAENVKKPADVILWLWKAHNKANGFLKGDPSEDPENRKQQFPPKALCAYCYQKDSDNFDESGVLEFLLKFYSDIKTDTQSYRYGVIDKSQAGGPIEKSLDVQSPKFRTVPWDKLVEEERDEKRKELENRLLRRGGAGGGRWNGSEDGERVGGIFNGFDLSLCFIVWLASVALVCIFCAYAKYRKGRHRLWKTLYGDLKV